MLSTKIRLQLEEICLKIELREEVSFNDMVMVEKYAKANRTVHDMLQRARRRAVNGIPEDGLDAFLDQMNIGNPDPSSHITGESSVDDIANFFKSDNNHMQRD